VPIPNLHYTLPSVQSRWPPAACPSLAAPCAVRRMAGGRLSPEALRVQELAFLRIENGRNVTLGGLGTIDGRGAQWCAGSAAQPSSQ
jgi:hypothetical protein